MPIFELEILNNQPLIVARPYYRKQRDNGPNSADTKSRAAD